MARLGAPNRLKNTLAAPLTEVGTLAHRWTGWILWWSERYSFHPAFQVIKPPVQIDCGYLQRRCQTSHTRGLAKTNGVVLDPDSHRWSVGLIWIRPGFDRDIPSDLCALPYRHRSILRAFCPLRDGKRGDTNHDELPVFDHRRRDDRRRRGGWHPRSRFNRRDRADQRGAGRSVRSSSSLEGALEGQALGQHLAQAGEQRG